MTRLCWKVHDREQSIVLRSYTLHELRNRNVYWLVPQSEVNNYCVLCTVKAKNRKKQNTTKNFVALHNHSLLLTMVMRKQVLNMMINLPNILTEIVVSEHQKWHFKGFLNYAQLCSDHQDHKLWSCSGSNSKPCYRSFHAMIRSMLKIHPAFPLCSP